MLLDVDRWAADRKARWDRLRFAGRFQEGDRVPVCFSVGGSYFCSLFGYDIREYYSNPELQVEIQLKGIEWEYETLKADSCDRESMGYDPGPIQEAVVFGAEIERHPGTSPRITHMIGSLDEGLTLEFPRPEDNPRLKAEIAKSERFAAAARKMGVKIPVNGMDTVSIHPPLSCLCAILDPAIVYEAVYEEPEKLKRVLDRCYEAFIAYSDRWWKPGGPNDAIWFADDNHAFISAAAFREFEMPYYHRAIERYRPKQFHLHADGPYDHLFPVHASESGVTNIDIGGFSRLETAVKYMKGKVYIHGGMNCNDLYGDGPLSDAARRKALAAMRLAGPGGGFQLGVGGETYVGVSPRALVDLVKLVEERGTYPISITEAETR
jgi:uroporphyrinogen-III decarboxylase